MRIDSSFKRKLSVRCKHSPFTYRWTKSQYWSNHRHAWEPDHLSKFHALFAQCTQRVNHRLKIYCKRWRLPGSVWEYSTLPLCQRSNPSWRWTRPSLPDVRHNYKKWVRSFWAERNFSSLQYDSKWSFLWFFSAFAVYVIAPIDFRKRLAPI